MVQRGHSAKLLRAAGLEKGTEVTGTAQGSWGGVQRALKTLYQRILRPPSAPL